MSTLKLEQIGHPDAVSNSLTFDSDGSISINGLNVDSAGVISGNLTVSGNIIPNNTSDYKVEYLVVAGGGSGAAGNGGGGGGAGGLLHGYAYVSQDSDYSIVIGAGGAGGGTSSKNNGVNSSFGSIVAIGGGAGGTNGGTINGETGGSGGGSCGDGNSPYGFQGSPGDGTAGQGNVGGKGWREAGRNCGGGGGGAGSPGQDAKADTANADYYAGGHGGSPLFLDIDGSSKPYAGGGGGATQSGPNTAMGLGGFGSGGDGTPGSGTAASGVANTGGGGAGNQSGGNGGSGGSGIVVIRYDGAQRGTGGTITSVNGFTIHKFTSSGTFSP